MHYFLYVSPSKELIQVLLKGKLHPVKEGCMYLLNQTYHIRGIGFVLSLNGEYTKRIIHHLCLCREPAYAATWQFWDGDAIEIIGIYADFYRLRRAEEYLSCQS